MYGDYFDMSSNLYQLFQEVETKGHVLSNCWQSFYDEIIQHLPESYHPEMEELSTKLEGALAQLIDDLHNPTLTLATTGTTSSGKSTLVNFLCGAEIVPVATSEMSAGVVTIEYSQDKALTISKTEGATWECGYWAQISDQEIYRLLEDAMLSYINNRESSPGLACPNALIQYPFRFLKDFDLNLPHRTKVKILDLPGLAHVGDESNAEVIRQCREALCLVTYNSAETDPNKTLELLQEVVQQVKALRGSPARMLFILNRIDEFRADRSWPFSEERFVEKTVKSIKDELTDQLQEYQSDIENIEIVKFSSWPALLAIQIKNIDPIAKVGASRKAKGHFYFLIEETLDELPGNPNRWSDHDFSRVAIDLQEKSYAQNFEQLLKKHITTHFPQLVIPQIVERFYVQAGNSMVEWSIQTTNAILNSSQTKYDAECAKIADVRNSLREFLDQSDLQLRAPFEKISEVITAKKNKDSMLYLEKTIKELQEVEPYSLIKDHLYPMYGWRRDIGQGINQVLEAVADSLTKGRVKLEGIIFHKANRQSVQQLENLLKSLIGMGYTGAVAKNGENRIAKTAEEQKNLQLLNQQLNSFALQLSIVMQEILSGICNESGDRIYDSINELFKFHLSVLEQRSSEIAPSLSIKFPESQLIKINQHPQFIIEMEAGFVVTDGTWQEKIEKEYKERPWQFLFLLEKTKTRTEYQQRTSLNADIPKVSILLETWLHQAKKAELNIASQILDWFIKQIDFLKKNVSTVQDEVFDRYQNRLDQAKQNISIDHEKEKNIWEPIHRKALHLKQEFSTLRLTTGGESNYNE